MWHISVWINVSIAIAACHCPHCIASHHISSLPCGCRPAGCPACSAWWTGLRLTLNAKPPPAPPALPSDANTPAAPPASNASSTPDGLGSGDGSEPMMSLWTARWPDASRYNAVWSVSLAANLDLDDLGLGLGLGVNGATPAPASGSGNSALELCVAVSSAAAPAGSASASGWSSWLVVLPCSTPLPFACSGTPAPVAARSVNRHTYLLYANELTYSEVRCGREGAGHAVHVSGWFGVWQVAQVH